MRNQWRAKGRIGRQSGKLAECRLCRTAGRFVAFRRRNVWATDQAGLDWPVVYRDCVNKLAFEGICASISRAIPWACFTTDASDWPAESLNSIPILPTGFPDESCSGRETSKPSFSFSVTGFPVCIASRSSFSHFSPMSDRSVDAIPTHPREVVVEIPISSVSGCFAWASSTSFCASDFPERGLGCARTNGTCKMNIMAAVDADVIKLPKTRTLVVFIDRSPFEHCARPARSLFH